MLKTEPLVSIIIPTFNRVNLIGKTLDSVLAQTYSNWECIVVDDGSIDDTVEVLKNYNKIDKRIQYHYRPKDKPKGANACRNYGVEKSKGEYLIFLDSDDLLEETCLEFRVGKVCDKKHIGSNEVFVFNMGLLIKGTKSSRVFNKNSGDNKQYLEQFLKGIVPWTITCVMWKKSCFIDVGKFDEKFLRLQDVDIHTRLLLNGIEIKKINRVDSWYRILDDVKDYVTESKLPRIINSHVKYVNKFYDYSVKNASQMSITDINTSLKTNYMNVLKKYVFRDRLIGFKQMMLLNKQYKILDAKELICIQLLAVYHVLKLNKRRGLGYYKLKEQSFR